MKYIICLIIVYVYYDYNIPMTIKKTEFITFIPKRYEYLVEHSSIIVGKNIITASLTVTNLGVVLDRNLTMAYQVSKTVRICTYKLRMVNIIRDKLSVHVSERVANAMVTGNLDHCNSLLHGITAGQLGRLQKIQNTAARLIFRRNSFILVQIWTKLVNMSTIVFMSVLFCLCLYNHCFICLLLFLICMSLSTLVEHISFYTAH